MPDDLNILQGIITDLENCLSDVAELLGQARTTKKWALVDEALERIDEMTEEEGEEAEGDKP